jgi:hypothetical protein
MHAAVGLYSLGERVEVNLGGERPFEFEFQTDQLSWAQPQLFGDVPAHFRTIPRLVSLGDSAILFSSRLNEHFVITGSAADQRWRFDRRIVMTPPETERISHDLTEYCIDSGELYALAQVAREPLLVLKFVMQPPAGGYWDVIEAAEDSPLQQAPIVTGASFVAIGDGLLAVLGGRRPTTDNRRDDENVPPIDDAVRQATYFFDLRRRHWLGVDQIVNGESGRSDAIESLLQVGVGRGATALGGGACGALLFGGWDSRRMRPDCIVMSVERVPVDVRRDHLRVVVSSPHLSGTSPVPRNRVALCSLGDGRFVASFGWDGSKRSADVDIGVMRANTSLQTRLLRALSTGAFSDTTLECDDRTRFAVHALVLQRRCSGLGALLRADGAASNVHRVRLSSSAHVALLLHYAYGDVLPSDTCMTSNEVRSFLNDCVAQLAPEHSERLTELLVSIRLATSSRFASDMTGAFALDSAAASDSDAELVLSDGRVAHVHRAVLTSGSAYFRGCFESMLADPTRRRIDVSEDDSALVLALLEHLYCGECEFDDELGGRVVELLSVACKFGCEELALRCEALMLPLVDASNARWLLAHANSLARPKLAAQCRDVLLRAGDGVAD